MTTFANPSPGTPEVKAALITAGSTMLQAGLPPPFVVDAVETAFKYEGVADLVQAWHDEPDARERDAIVADLQDLIDDCAKPGYTESPAIRFDDLDAIAADIRAFKDSLRVIVDERGGVGKLAEATGIPQPSLSRFFESLAMPRRATLLKLAKALELRAVPLTFPGDR